ncbi:transporter substrate-binding domain-containing protein [Turicibacter sanguinis]|uniref:transporter substrate-binding domain-containing protein n=1 Tax=Turicibacter sanguinis TaxID=154288 RepID=UPI0012BB9127|nr:transporter substrate-binding domain-containing protein [Turicibacter sanguinis]MDB8567942.1 transporter substrate-binding domain-containing protein [Turicibacter sanguinis]MDB8570691.1 transporter substrate-binding domain-containing protein [Turicibacter sanguinis]MDB8573445.1 transporter substrate-binding domain-containing protein [Turicibacter sanguinis]MDB8582204.1 transporter substrate-binding domain-containing protein [Turicibacter sanguinis]MTO10837.1 transporter substrate-binding do
MKKMIKGLVFIGICLSVLGGCAQSSNETSRFDKIKETKKITMATSPDYAPYEFIDPTKSGSEQYVGADIELGKYIAQKLGVELELKIMDFSAVLAAISEGKADMAISGLGYKPERAEAMEFSEAYNTSEDGDGDGFLIRAEDVEKYKTLEDFNGVSIAAQSASLQEGYVKDQLPNAQINTIASLSDGVLRVQSGKSDALAISYSTGEQYVNANKDLVMSSVLFEGNDSEGTMIGIVKGETELVEAINEIIQEVKEQGLYQQWEEAHIAYAKSLGIE